MANGNNYLRVVFETNLDGRDVRKAEHEMVRGQNKLCDLANPCLETWNNIFAEKNGDDMFDSPEYNEFMRDKYQRLVDLYMNDKNFSKMLTYQIGPDINLEGTLRKDPTRFIKFHLEPEE